MNLPALRNVCNCGAPLQILNLDLAQNATLQVVGYCQFCRCSLLVSFSLYELIELCPRVDEISGMELDQAIEQAIAQAIGKDPFSDLSEADLIRLRGMAVSSPESESQ